MARGSGLTDRSVVGVQVLGSHKLRHQGALADGGGAQHEDAVRRRTLGRAALPRARQRTRRRVSRRPWVRGGQVLRAASNRREARRVSRLGMQLDHRGWWAGVTRGFDIRVLLRRARLAATCLERALQTKAIIPLGRSEHSRREAEGRKMRASLSRGLTNCDLACAGYENRI